MDLNTWGTFARFPQAKKALCKQNMLCWERGKRGVCGEMGLTPRNNPPNALFEQSIPAATSPLLQASPSHSHLAREGVGRGERMRERCGIQH